MNTALDNNLHLLQGPDREPLNIPNDRPDHGKFTVSLSVSIFRYEIRFLKSICNQLYLSYF